jgi:hypothetical protein
MLHFTQHQRCDKNRQRINSLKALVHVVVLGHMISDQPSERASSVDDGSSRVESSPAIALARSRSKRNARPRAAAIR